jgi:hypothetical protein
MVTGRDPLGAPGDGEFLLGGVAEREEFGSRGERAVEAGSRPSSAGRSRPSVHPAITRSAAATLTTFGRRTSPLLPYLDDIIGQAPHHHRDGRTPEA